MRYIAYVGIDNGHGKNTPGKRLPDSSMREWEFNYATAKYLKAELEFNNFRILMLSDTIGDTPLSVRSSRANNAKVDICVSIHANALRDRWPNPSESAPEGIETFAYSPQSKGNVLAKYVQEELIKSTKLVDRGVKYSNLHMTREPFMPAILVECGFMDNPREAELLKSDDYRKTCAKAIAKGICRYFGVEYKSYEVNEPDEVNETDEVRVEPAPAEVEDKVKIYPVVNPTKRNDWVRRLQIELNRQGFRDYNGSRLTIDGYAGAKTLSACPVLYKGKNGGLTKLLQEFLGVVKDGSFGPNTEDALKEYQKSKELDADGYCGPKTWRKILGL